MRCRLTLRCPRRIEEAASALLVEKFSREPDVQSGCERRATDQRRVALPPSEVAASVDGDRVVVHLDGEPTALSRPAAAELCEQLGAALSQRREFFRTAGQHRRDGSYVVSRRGADSSGHRKVFDSFEHLRRLYDRLPEEFTAEEVGRSGLTGGRRHMLVRHFVEHPAFDCELTSRQPLTVRKRASEAGVGSATRDAEPVDDDADRDHPGPRPLEVNPADG